MDITVNTELPSVTVCGQTLRLDVLMNMDPQPDAAAWTLSFDENGALIALRFLPESP